MEDMIITFYRNDEPHPKKPVVTIAPSKEAAVANLATFYQVTNEVIESEWYSDPQAVFAASGVVLEVYS